MKSRYNFTLSPEAFQILRALADKNGVSMSAMLEIIIRQEKQQLKKAWDAAWNLYHHEECGGTKDEEPDYDSFDEWLAGQQ